MWLTRLRSWPPPYGLSPWVLVDSISKCPSSVDTAFSLIAVSNRVWTVRKSFGSWRNHCPRSSRPAWGYRLSWSRPSHPVRSQESWRTINMASRPILVLRTCRTRTTYLLRKTVQTILSILTCGYMGSQPEPKFRKITDRYYIILHSTNAVSNHHLQNAKISSHTQKWEHQIYICDETDRM